MRIAVAVALALLAFPVRAADSGTRPDSEGERNAARSVSRGPRGEHRQNGRSFLVSARATPELRERVLKGRFGTVPSFGEPRSGHLLLQDHGERVSFRTITQREPTGTQEPQPP